jgi:D-alanine-D-alanine ligase
MKKLTLALLYGGISSEREVSINSGNQVYEALDKKKYDVLRYDTKTDLAKLVADSNRIDVALIILHGLYGEDGTVQGLLDLLDIPYQGSKVLGSAIAMNKLISKQLYQHNNIPTPPFITVRQDESIDPKKYLKQLGLPLVTKPVEGGSSVGMTIVTSEESLKPAMDTAFEHDGTIMLEAYIEGVEITGGVIGNNDLQALPLIEIIPNEDHDFFDYEAKYVAGVSQEICPARIDEKLTQKAQTLAKMAHTALACKGYSRTDMILPGRDIIVLETNTIPGMTATSLLPQAAAAAGLDFSRLLDKLIELSIEERSACR